MTISPSAATESARGQASPPTAVTQGPRCRSTARRRFTSAVLAPEFNFLKKNPREKFSWFVDAPLAIVQAVPFIAPVPGDRTDARRIFHHEDWTRVETTSVLGLRFYHFVRQKRINTK